MSLGHQLYVVVNDYSEEDPILAWEVRRYSPGQGFAEGSAVTGQATELILDACLGQKTDVLIDWNDRQKATALYWQAKGA